MIFILYLTLFNGIFICEINSAENNETRMMKEIYMFEAVKLFCSSKNLSTNFCSRENLKYMFWFRPNDYEKLIEYLSKPKKVINTNQEKYHSKATKFSLKYDEDMKKQMAKLNNRRFNFMSEFSQPRYL